MRKGPHCLLISDSSFHLGNLCLVHILLEWMECEQFFVYWFCFCLFFSTANSKALGERTARFMDAWEKGTKLHLEWRHQHKSHWKGSIKAQMPYFVHSLLLMITWHVAKSLLKENSIVEQRWIQAHLKLFLKDLWMTFICDAVASICKASIRANFWVVD